MKHGGLAVIAVFCCAAAAFSALQTVPGSLERQTGVGVFVSGERLQYKVKWLFFRLGTIVITTEELPGNIRRYRTSITLDSNPDLFFISIHNRYEAVINVDPVRCDQFRALEIDGKDTLVTGYLFVDSLRRVIMEQRLLPPDTLIKEGVKDSIDRFFDGASLFFFARTMIHEDTTVSVPTLVEFDMFETTITFTGILASVTPGALDSPVRTRELFGNAGFEGTTFGGFSGDFKGWFSDDDAAIPIQAEMSITLGTVDVELEQWSRTGWRPPMIQEQR